MKSKLPILYTFRRCPYAIRARLAIAYSQQAIILREVLLKDKPKELLELSPKATVPVLKLVDGQVIDESLDIMYWALGRSDPANWLSKSAEKQSQISKLIDENDRQFKSNLDRYKYAAHYPEQSAIEYRTLGEHFLERLEQLLNLTTYLVGDSMTLADAAIFPFVRQFAGVEPLWFQKAPYPKLRFWLKQSLESELFGSVMTKHAQWRQGDTPIVFPSSS